MNQIANIVSSLTPQAREALRQELIVPESSDFVAVIGAVPAWGDHVPGKIVGVPRAWRRTPLTGASDTAGPVVPVTGPVNARLGRLHRRRGWLDARRFGISPQQRHLLK